MFLLLIPHTRESEFSYDPRDFKSTYRDYAKWHRSHVFRANLANSGPVILKVTEGDPAVRFQTFSASCSPSIDTNFCSVSNKISMSICSEPTTQRTI